MKRILILGSSGAGKSTLARRMGQATGLPVYHLDALLWQPGWQMPPRDEQRTIQESVVEQDAWIIDGNYTSTIELRLARADTVVFLTPPRRVCLRRAAGRTLRHFGRTRPDMGPECPEHIDLEFIRYIWNWKAQTHPRIMEAIARQGDRLHVITLANNRETERFLQSLKRIV